VPSRAMRFVSRDADGRRLAARRAIRLAGSRPCWKEIAAEGTADGLAADGRRRTMGDLAEVRGRSFSLSPTCRAAGRSDRCSGGQPARKARAASSF